MKYRVELRYWTDGSGYNYNETFENFEADSITNDEAEKYVEECKGNGIDFLDGTDYDAVNVEIYDDDDNLISETWITTEYYEED